MTNLPEAIAATARAEIARRQILQRDLAATLGLSQAALSDRLNGKTPFTLRDVEGLARALSIDVRVLISAALAEVTE